MWHCCIKNKYHVTWPSAKTSFNATFPYDNMLNVFWKLNSHQIKTKAKFPKLKIKICGNGRNFGMLYLKHFLWIVLIRVDYLWHFQRGCTIRGMFHEPVAAETELGWVFSGPLERTWQIQRCTLHPRKFYCKLCWRVRKTGDTGNKRHYWPGSWAI